MKKLIFKSLLICVALFQCLGVFAAANKVGDVVTNIINLDDRKKVSLPEAVWDIAETSEYRAKGRTWNYFLLKNRDGNSITPYLLINYTIGGLFNFSIVNDCIADHAIYNYYRNEYTSPPKDSIKRCSTLENYIPSVAWGGYRNKGYQVSNKNSSGLLYFTSLKEDFINSFTRVQKENGDAVEINVPIITGKIGISPSDHYNNVTEFNKGKAISNYSVFNNLIDDWLYRLNQAAVESFINGNQVKVSSFSEFSPLIRASIKSGEPIEADTYALNDVAYPEGTKPKKEQERLLANQNAKEQLSLAEEARLKLETQQKEQQRLASEASQKEQARLAQEAKQKEQERLLAEQKAKEQSRLAEETKVKEQQRLALEAQQKEQARLAQEAKQKEQERLLADQKVKEQLRLAEETAKAKDLELAKLKEELASMKLQKENAVPAPSARKALVIGNDNYSSVAKLSNARQDANAVGRTLTDLGYKVMVKNDLTEKDMKATLRQFKNDLEGGDEVVIFYAGHGIQIGSTNYLLPTDIKGESEDQVRDDAIQLQRLLDDMNEKKVKLTLAMIDACRDNPFPKAGRAIGTRGLAPTTAATGQMIIFSAGSGQQALDKLGPTDKNPNGLFTRMLLSEMKTPGVRVDNMIREVRRKVVDAAKSVGHEQVPAIYDQVVGDFYFNK